MEKDEFIKTIGIYRIGPSNSVIQSLQISVDEGNIGVLENVKDPHVLAGLLKLFLRTLKEPLIPWNIVEKLYEAAMDQKFMEMKNLLIPIPQSHKATLTCLLKHLHKVNEFAHKNLMEYTNLATIFGPTLMWAPTPSTNAGEISIVLTLWDQQKGIVEQLLHGFDEIFPIPCSECDTS